MDSSGTLEPTLRWTPDPFRLLDFDRRAESRKDWIKGGSVPAASAVSVAMAEPGSLETLGSARFRGALLLEVSW